MQKTCMTSYDRSLEAWDLFHTWCDQRRDAHPDEELDDYDLALLYGEESAQYTEVRRDFPKG